MATDEANENEGPNENVPTVHELLDAKRRELADAHDALKVAAMSYDTDGVVAAQARIAVVDNFITNLEIDVAQENEIAGKAAAEARIVGCRRALGSLASEMDEDVKRVAAAHAVLVEAVERINDRYRDVLRTRAEVLALADRFDVPVGKLPDADSPAYRVRVTMPTFADVPNPIRPIVEEDEWGMRRRRTYDEMRGTKAFDIIQTVGPKAWPPLTEQQQRAVASVEAQAKRKANVDLSALPFVPAEGTTALAGTL